MSIQELVKIRYSEDLVESKDIEELDLNEIGFLPFLQPSDKEYMEKFKGISSLCLSKIGLSSLENLPKLDSVYILNLNKNKLKDGLKIIVRNMPYIEELELEYNCFEDIKEFEVLRELPNLTSITLEGNPIISFSNYRDELFRFIPQLKLIDNYDKDENNYLEDLIEREGDKESMNENMENLEDEIYDEDLSVEITCKESA